MTVGQGDDAAWWAGLNGGSAGDNTQAGAYTLTANDAGRVIRMTSAAAVALTVPPASAVPFPVGTVVLVRQWGAGQVTVTPGAGVTVRSRGPALKTAGQYGSALLTKVGADEWLMEGDTTA